MTSDSTPALFPTAAPPAETSPPSAEPRPADLVPIREAAKSIDRAVSTLRYWIQTGDLKAYYGEGTHEKNRPVFVSAEELRVLVVKMGKQANPGRRPPAEEEDDLHAAQLATVRAEAAAAVARAEVEGLRRALETAEDRAGELRSALSDLRGALEREQARADGAEAELTALRAAAGAPWWRRLLPGS
jgi:hypothetical protein